MPWTSGGLVPVSLCSLETPVVSACHIRHDSPNRLAGFLDSARFIDNRVGLTGDSGSSPYEVEYENNEGDHEQQMDEPASDMKSESSTPKKQEKNGND
jgi:hypothetical protein